MESKINYINELSLRVYNKIAEKNLSDFLIDGKPLIETDDIINHITSNLNDFLTKDEQRQLIEDNLGGMDTDNEEICSAVLKLAIQIAAVSYQTAIEKALTNVDFVGDNPYSPIANPRMFLLYKFYDEEFGIKLQPESLGELQGM